MGYVLPLMEMTQYISIGPSDHFGIVDIIASSKKHSIDSKKWFNNMGHMKRHFTVQAISDCELLSLSNDDFKEIRTHFYTEYNELMTGC
jgi:CRP-like cAMP-binding protein